MTCLVFSASWPRSRKCRTKPAISSCKFIPRRVVGVIGRDGETLEAIQFLLNRLVQAKDKDAAKIIVDCEHYRSMREDQIVQRVRELAERVRVTGRSLQLEPMNSYERRIVHNAFKDDPDVATWSPSDSARIKQITLLKRQPQKEHSKEASAS